MIPVSWLSHGSVARRSRVPLARFSSPARLSAVSVRTTDVAGHDARRVAAERARVIALGDERVSSRGVLLAALEDELDPTATIRLDVLRCDALRCAVHDDVHLAEQIIEGSIDSKSSVPHRIGRFRCRTE